MRQQPGFRACLVSFELCVSCVAQRPSAKGCGGVRGLVPTSLARVCKWSWVGVDVVMTG